MKMMQISYLDIWQCFCLGKCLIGAIQVNYFGMGYYSRKKTNRGGEERLWTYFFEKNPEFFLLFFCTFGNSSKAKLHPWKFGKIMYVTSLENFKARTKNENYLQPVTLTGWLFPLTDFNAGFWAQYVAFTSSSASDITLNSCTNELPLRYQ